MEFETHRFNHIGPDPHKLRVKFCETMKGKLPGTVYWRQKPLEEGQYMFDHQITRCSLYARFGIGPVTDVAFVDPPPDPEGRLIIIPPPEEKTTEI